MAEGVHDESGYAPDETGRLELIWGEGFMSPGGADEVTRIVGDHDLAGSDVLDIGCGTGGAAVVLVRSHGAASVTGVDVQAEQVDRATQLAAQHGLSDRVAHRRVEPGPLAFAEASFDAVFSKDSVIHVRDKQAIYAEAHRLLRPGGRLLVGDWLRGDGADLDDAVAAFVDAAGHDFAMVSLREVGEIVDRIGFVDVELEDRRDWYLVEAAAELERLRGALGTDLAGRWGEEALVAEIDFWEILVRSLDAGALRPGHVRAVKPTR